MTEPEWYFDRLTELAEARALIETWVKWTAERDEHGAALDDAERETLRQAVAVLAELDARLRVAATVG